MAWGKGCDSILTHRRQRGPLVRKVVSSRQQCSVSDLLPCFPCLFPLPRHSLYQFWSSFTLSQSHLAVAAVLDGGKERVMPQLFSSSCTSWTSFLPSQQCPVQTGNDCRPCAPHWAIQCCGGRTRAAENESIRAGQQPGSHFLGQTGKPHAALWPDWAWERFCSSDPCFPIVCFWLGGITKTECFVLQCMKRKCKSSSKQTKKAFPSPSQRDALMLRAELS